MSCSDFRIGLYNYYGAVRVYEEGGMFYMSLGDYSGESTITISEELYKLLQKEFLSKN